MLDSCVVILVRPQLGSNIAAVARVMHNFSCNQLRLVNPRSNWRNSDTDVIATNAVHLLDQAMIYQTLNDAVADLHLLFALTARTRFINKPILDIKNINNIVIDNKRDKIGLIFGPENSGLSNEDIVIAHKLFNIATNPDFSSLNLAQAVAITLHQLYDNTQYIISNSQASPKATRSELVDFLNHLEYAIAQTNFIQVENKQASMMRNIKNIFTRIENLTSQEIKTLRGIVTALSKTSDNLK